MPHEALRKFLVSCSGVMADAIDDNGPFATRLREGQQIFANVVASAEGKAGEPGNVDILDSAPDLEAGPLTAAFNDLVRQLPWTPSFRGTDEGTQIALCSANALLDFGARRAGFVYVGGGFVYPEHQHHPQELYLTIAGSGDWLHGARTEYQRLEAGQVIYNPLDSLHGVKALERPLVALYFLW